MKTTDIQKFLKKNQKPLLIALGVLAVVVVVWIVIKKRRNPQGLKTESEIESSTGTNITSSLDFYHLAERLWNATVSYRSLPIIVSWWPTGTNEKEVYAVLECLNTQADYMMLENAWVNYYKQKSWYVQHMNLQAESTVPAILRSELDANELQRCRDILTAKGITPDF